MFYKSFIFPVILILIGLTSTAVLPMEKQATKISELIQSVQTSKGYEWFDQYKTPILIGSCALLTAGIIYKYFFEKPTPQQIKSRIRKETANDLISYANNARNGINNNGGKVRKSTPPSNKDYTMTVKQFKNNAGITATYYYVCDNSTETVDILFENQKTT